MIGALLLERNLDLASLRSILRYFSYFVTKKMAVFTICTKKASSTFPERTGKMILYHGETRGRHLVFF